MKILISAVIFLLLISCEKEEIITPKIDLSNIKRYEEPVKFPKLDTAKYYKKWKGN